MNKIIYHVTTKEEWETAIRKGFYEAASLAAEGFTHCSELHQVNGVLQRYFSEKANLVKITIDTSKLISKLQYDFSPSINESFPHIYGAINLDAVTVVENIY